MIVSDGSNSSLMHYIKSVQDKPDVAPLVKKAEKYGIHTGWLLPGLMDYEDYPGDTEETYVARLKKEIKEYEEKHNINDK
ncbi:MAG: hypothetical protein ACI39G_05840 [Pseudoramibacter sp.]